MWDKANGKWHDYCHQILKPQADVTRLKNGMGSCNSFVIAIWWEKSDLLSEGLYLKQGSVEHGTCSLAYAPIVTTLNFNLQYVQAGQHENKENDHQK